MIDFASSGLFVFTLLLLMSCASATFKVSSLEPGSTISVVGLDNLSSEGKKMNNPGTVDMAKLGRSAVKVSAKGKATEYFFFNEKGTRAVDVRVRQLPNCQKEQEVDRNRPTRLLLKSYQSLSINDFPVALELATKAAEIDPSLAAPHIISGLVHYKQGKKEAARISFNKAKGLDPDDKDIDELLRMVQ